MFGLAVVFIYTDTRKLLHEKNVIIHFTADQLPVFCALLSAPGKYCNGYLLYTTGNIIGKKFTMCTIPLSWAISVDFGRFLMYADVN